MARIVQSLNELVQQLGSSEFACLYLRHCIGVPDATDELVAMEDRQP
jgi:hypothetical protein